jgi:AraC-like DNA-binding protein
VCRDISEARPKDQRPTVHSEDLCSLLSIEKTLWASQRRSDKERLSLRGMGHAAGERGPVSEVDLNLSPVISILVNADRLDGLTGQSNGNVALCGGGGAPTTIVCGSLSFDSASLKPITQLLPSFILMKADQARTLALHTTVQALASEMAEQAPGSGVVATRLAEVLFIQILRAHIASEPEHNKGWLRAVFDPQIGTALSAIHDRVDTPWSVESLAEAAGMSRSGFAARFKELLGQTPLEYVTRWRMQKAMQLLEQRDKKLIDVVRLVGYESDAAFSKAFKRVVGANTGEYIKRGFEGHGKAGIADHDQSR